MGLVQLDDRKKAGVGGNRGVPRNKKDQPLIKVMVPSPIKRDPGRMKELLKPYTRMTTWIDCLDDKSAIAMWKQRLAVIGLARVPEDERPALIAEILAADAAGNKAKLNGIAGRMHRLAGGEDKANKGDELHEYSEFVDRGEAVPGVATEADMLDMAAYKLATIDLVVKEIECFVVNDEFKVGGTPDRMSWYDGPDPDGLEPAGHLITDLKTGRVDYGGLKMAMQLGGYAHAKPYDPEAPFETSRSEWPADLNLKWGLIINAPAGTGTCEVMWVDLTLGWEGFLLCKQVRALRTRGRRAFATFPSPSLTVASESTEDGEDGDDE